MVEFGTLDHVLFFGRNYDEIVTLLLLDEKKLVGKRILDCPSGPDAFVAEAKRQGLDVTGCDPLFDRPAKEIAEIARRDIQHVWDRIKKMGSDALLSDEEIEDKLAATAKFEADFDEGKAAGRYVHAALPELPFEDDSFDLVVSANFLFMYSDGSFGGVLGSGTFDLAFHAAAVRELIRVSRGEVRLHPITTVERKQHLHPYAAQVIGQLASEGVVMRFEDVPDQRTPGLCHRTLIIEQTCAAHE